MRLEVDDADRLVAFAVDAENLHLLVRGRTVRLVDLRIVHAGISAHLAVLHEVAAAEGDALRDGTLVGHLSRLEVGQCVHGRIGNAGYGHAPVDVGDFILTTADRRCTHLLLHRKVATVVRMGGVENNRVAVETGRLHNGVAHIVGNGIRQRLGIQLHDNSLGLAVGHGDAHDLQWVEYFFRPAILVVSRHEHAKRRRDVGFGVARHELSRKERHRSSENDCHCQQFFHDVSCFMLLLILEDVIVERCPVAYHLCGPRTEYRIKRFACRRKEIAVSRFSRRMDHRILPRHIVGHDRQKRT